MYSAQQPYENTRSKRTEGLTDFQQAKVIDYMKVVKWVVSRIISRLPQHIKSEDLVHSGILGLIDAAQRFSWGRENEADEFKAYAECRIRGQIMDELRRLDVLPRSARGKVNKFNKANEELQHKLKRAASESEICEYMGIDIDTCHQLRADASFGRQVPLDACQSGSDSIEGFLQKALNLVDPQTPEGMLHVQEVKSILAREIDRLSERERQVISLYYLEEMTLKEIGLILSVTESRVSQIHAGAMKKLMKRLQTSLGMDWSLGDEI